MPWDGSASLQIEAERRQNQSHCKAAAVPKHPLEGEIEDQVCENPRVRVRTKRQTRQLDEP
ncbi:MAG: hypothetical protein GPJ29_17950 [Microcystis aeruginosa BK11-02]|nr:hypothetical protein [Microcystis aeruginosa BK11-02]NCS76286.1 hypothetical protein [Microcystis aeruginosa K13-07]